MVIKNLTSSRQKVEAKEIVGGDRVYDIFIAPNGTTELDNHLRIDLSKYVGIIGVEGMDPVPQVVPEVSTSTEESVEKEETNPVESVPEEVISEETETVSEEKDSAPDAFICDICGAEFASARGLNSHKNKAHA